LDNKYHFETSAVLALKRHSQLDWESKLSDARPFLNDDTKMK